MVFLSNGVTSAMENGGSINWFPCPKFDSPSIFSGILDERRGGYFSIAPEGRYKLKTRYIDDTLIAENVFSTGRGELKVTDFLPLGISGIVRIYESKTPFIADIKPMFNYGMINPGVEYVEGGALFKNSGSREGLEISMQGKYSITDDGLFRISPGKGYIFAMYSKDLRYGLFSNKGFVFPDPYDSLAKTLKYWKDQFIPAKKSRSRFSEIYRRSILVSLGLIYQPSGAIIAAPTTSLPEIVGQGRNWDYRYLWIRDASYAVEALISIGYTSKAKRILDFMLSVMDPSSKNFDHPLYSIDGTPPPPEEVIGWLSGNKNSKPVRIGNSAYMQIQTDTEGTFMAAFYSYLARTNEKSYVMENWLLIETVVEWISKSWNMVSTSLWEERDTLKHFVHTKVMQWVAVDRASRMASMIGRMDEAESWGRTAAAIKKDIMSKGFSSEANSFVQHYGSNEVDSALLALPLYGFIDAKDPMFVSTLKKVEKDLLVDGGLLLRYRSDFLGSAAHPFTLSSTWLARVYLRMGEMKKAEKVIEHLSSMSTEMMLIPEHIDYKTKEPRGNMPQLFPHAGIIHAIAEFEDHTLFEQKA